MICYQAGDVLFISPEAVSLLSAANEFVMNSAASHGQPVSHVSAFSGTAPSPNFPVQWSGSDTCSTIRAFDIYVPDNGGPFTVLLSQTVSTGTYYVGMLGHTYRFYAIASFNSGSQETTETVKSIAAMRPSYGLCWERERDNRDSTRGQI
jgi:hypothetical protein